MVSINPQTPRPWRIWLSRSSEDVDLFASSGTGRDHLPGAIPPRRSILWPALVICACTLVLGVALMGCQPFEARQPLAAICALANLVSAIAAFARAGEQPAEARGWRMLGSSLALLAIANLAAGLARWSALPAFHNLFPITLGVLSQGLAAAALLCMPWKSTGLNWRPRNLLGSGLFVGSILLMLWTLTDWEAGFGSHDFINLALLAVCGRVTLLGGITLMLLEQDSRRIRGVLGFVLASVLLGGFHVALLQNLLVRGWLPFLPLASVYSFTPLVLGLAAWSRAPLEYPVEPPQSVKVWVFLPYVTFAMAAAAILLQFLASGTVAGVPLVGFIVLTWLLLVRQFLLLRELRLFNRSLEDRVVDRTRDLEAMQSAVLRTERLNTMASLGAGIAHDLNNFLVIIQSSVEMLQEGTEGNLIEHQRNLERLHATTGRAAALASRLLRFARTDPEPRQALDLAGELERQEDLLRILLPTNIRLRMELAPGPFPILSRPSNLE
jgi:signal transduction histidine kinase